MLGKLEGRKLGIFVGEPEGRYEGTNIGIFDGIPFG